MLRKLKRGADDELVFDTTDFRRRFENACLKLGFAKKGWECAQCLATDLSTAKTEEKVCPNCKCPMKYTKIGLTPHGLRRSMVVHYRDAGLADSLIMTMSGHQSPDVYSDYAVSSVPARREGQREAQKRSQEKREERTKHKVRAIR